MNQQKKNLRRAAVVLLAAFGTWTAAVCLVDVRPIGPNGSEVGLSALNQWFHQRIGVHPALYHVTDWLMLVPLAIMLGFAVLGIIQWVRRKSLAKVDVSLFVLGGFYLTVLAAYVFFEKCPVNYRPVLLDGTLEVSYPSSTTLLALTALPTAALQFRERIRRPVLRRLVLWGTMVLTVLLVLGRVISGVHWFSDIVGGVLLSGGLVALYASVIRDGDI